jgi:hypothetical protein
VSRCNFKKVKGNTLVDDDIKEFQQIAIKVKRFLKKVDDIKPEVIKKDNGKTFIITAKITKYVMKHKKKVEIIRNKLEKFITKYPNSEWADDAVILLGIMYLTINLKEAPFTQEAINIYSKIMELDRELNINPWTKKLISDLTASVIFYPFPGEDWMVNLKENEIIKISFSRALITEYLKTKEFDRAKQLLEMFKNRKDAIGAYQNIEILRDYIDKWKNIAIQESSSQLLNLYFQHHQLPV